MLACPPHHGETSATIWGVGSRHVTPSPPEHQVTGHIRSYPPPRAITRRKTRCQSYGRHEERPPQLTRTDPSQTIYPRQSHAPAGPGRNHTASRQGSEPAAATTTREPAPGAHTARVVERARKRDTTAETHFDPAFQIGGVGWYVAVSHCHAVSHNVNTVLLQYAPNLLNVPLIHAGNTNATVNLTVTVLHNFKLKRDTVQTKNDFPAQ